MLDGKLNPSCANTYLEAATYTAHALHEWKHVLLHVCGNEPQQQGAAAITGSCTRLDASALGEQPVVELRAETRADERAVRVPRAGVHTATAIEKRTRKKPKQCRNAISNMYDVTQLSHRTLRLTPLCNNSDHC